MNSIVHQGGVLLLLVLALGLFGRIEVHRLVQATRDSPDLVFVDRDHSVVNKTLQHQMGPCILIGLGLKLRTSLEELVQLLQLLSGFFLLPALHFALVLDLLAGASPL